MFWGSALDFVPILFLREVLQDITCPTTALPGLFLAVKRRLFISEVQKAVDKFFSFLCIFQP